MTDPPLADPDTRRNREWRVITEEVRDGAMNMALDEVAARTAATGGPRTVRVYAWEPSTLTLGYAQDPGTVDWAFCREEGITVTRRPTGGGGIYHDRFDDVSYSIVAPKPELPGDLLTSYHLLCTPIRAAFEAVGVSVEYIEEAVPARYHPSCYLRERHPAHDMIAADGRKIAGNAQYRQRDAVVQHGSLSYALSPRRHLACFTGHDVTPAEYRHLVTGVSEVAAVSREEFVGAVETALTDWTAAAEGTWTEAERTRAQRLAEEKYRADTWVRDGEDPTD